MLYPREGSSSFSYSLIVFMTTVVLPLSTRKHDDVCVQVLEVNRSCLVFGGGLALEMILITLLRIPYLFILMQSVDDWLYLTDNLFLWNLATAKWGPLASADILWSKSSRNSFRKFKIQVLFIKSDIVPFEVLPIDCNALMPTLDPALETFLELYCRYSHQSHLRFFHYLLSAVKTRSP